MNDGGTDKMTQLQALAWTLILEMPVVLLGARLMSAPPGRAILAGLAASGLSHPVAWKLALISPPDAFLLSWTVIEFAVTLFETIVLKVVMRLRWLQALALSLAANVFSAGAGWWLV